MKCRFFFNFRQVNHKFKPPMYRNILFCFILIPCFARAGNDNKISGARSFAMGKASVAFFDQWSAFNNQAGLALLQEKSFGFYYENKFAVKELAVKSAYVNIPLKSSCFSGTYTQFGFNLYRESTIGISYSRALGEKFYAAVKFNQIRRVLQSEYGSQSRYAVEFGILSELFNDFFLGFHIDNPTQAKFNTLDYEDPIPTVFRFGFMYRLSNELILSSELHKEIQDVFGLKIGIEYQIAKKFYFRAGVHNHPNEVSLGVGFKFSRCKANLAFSRHPVLGYTPVADINFQF